MKYSIYSKCKLHTSIATFILQPEYFISLLTVGNFISSAGAMRLPCHPKDSNKTHFLPDFYITKFGLTVVDFVNENENGFLKFYNMPKVRICGKVYLCD